VIKSEKYPHLTGNIWKHQSFHISIETEGKEIYDSCDCANALRNFHGSEKEEVKEFMKELSLICRLIFDPFEDHRESLTGRLGW
jgi:hypothetical protein